MSSLARRTLVDTARAITRSASLRRGAVTGNARVGRSGGHHEEKPGTNVPFPTGPGLKPKLTFATFYLTAASIPIIAVLVHKAKKKAKA